MSEKEIWWKKSNNAKTNDPMTVWLHFAPYHEAQKKAKKK